MSHLKIKEDEKTEFKLTFQEKVIETLVAFANTSGGTVYIGVNDDGIVEGITLGKESLQKWLNEIKSKTEPSIIPNIAEHQTEDKTYVTISVQEFPVKPLSFKGRYFKRLNNSNHRLTANEITDMNLQSLQLSWDSYIKTDKALKDLSVEKIENFIRKVNSSKRFRLSGDWKSDLEKLRLIKGDEITNAAWLLFAKDGIEYNIHLGRFKTPSYIIDDRMMNDSLFNAVEDAMNFIIGHLKVAFKITGETAEREEIFEYPLTAIRELLLNAVVHRDYLSPIDTQIKIFDHEITFFNPGKLFGGLSVEDLKHDNYQANTRNKLIAEMFYLTGAIEKYGSGFIRIREAIKDYPGMELDIINAPNGILTRIGFLTDDHKNDHKNDHENDHENDHKNDHENKPLTGKETAVKRRQARIMEAIRNHPKITMTDLAKKLKVSHSTIKRDLEDLKKRSVIERVGSASGGIWVITEKK